MSKAEPSSPVRGRSIFLMAASIGVAVILIAVLIVVSRVDLRETLSRLGSMDRMAFARLSILMAFYTFLASQKWRLIDGAMRGAGEPAVPTSTAFVLTSLGTALGQVLPVQISVSIARTLGTWMQGRALQRGTVGTLLEQAFDLIVVCFLAFATAGTRLLHGGAATWVTLAFSAALLAILLVAPSSRLIGRLARRVGAPADKASRWRRVTLELARPELWDARLGRRLMALSLLRFVVLVLMAGQTTAAIHSDIPLWHFAAAMPFVVLATSVLITPGGVGVNEFTYAGMLSTFGTPLSATTQWALANRVLYCTASLVVAIMALVFWFGIKRRKIAGSNAVARTAQAGRN